MFLETWGACLGDMTYFYEGKYKIFSETQRLNPMNIIVFSGIVVERFGLNIGFMLW